IRAEQVLRRALGGELDRRVGPIAAITFVYGASFMTFWIYVGIFAVRALHWPASRVGLLFLASAPAAAIANYLSGRISDRVGRKRPIVVSFLTSAADVTALSVLGAHTTIAFALILLLGVICAPAFSLNRVLVADVISVPDEREEAYATVRIASNVGGFAGPPFAALLIFLGGWTSFLLGIAALGVLGATVAMVFLPPAGEAIGADVPKLVSMRAILRDRPFALLLLSTLFAFTVYCGFEAVLPVVAVSAYGLAPSTWGLLVVINPLLVILFQMRLTRVSARIAASQRLAAATMLMGLPFLILLKSSTVAV